MIQILKNITGWALIIVAIVALILSVIPLLAPLVFGIALTVILLSLVVLFIVERVSLIGADFNIDAKFVDRLLAVESNPRPNSPLRNSLRYRAGFALKIALLAIAINVTLALVLYAYSYLVYINPMSHDLEPVRDIFRKGAH